MNIIDKKRENILHLERLYKQKTKEIFGGGRMKKIPLKTASRIYKIGGGTGLAAAFTGVVFDEISKQMEILIWAGIDIMIAAVIFACIFLRCPRCGGTLFRNWGGYCQHCGEELDR